MEVRAGFVEKIWFTSSSGMCSILIKFAHLLTYRKTFSLQNKLIISSFILIHSCI